MYMYFSHTHIYTILYICVKYVCIYTTIFYTYMYKYLFMYEYMHAMWTNRPDMCVTSLFDGIYLYCHPRKHLFQCCAY